MEIQGTRTHRVELSAWDASGRFVTEVVEFVIKGNRKRVHSSSNVLAGAVVFLRALSTGVAGLPRLTLYRVARRSRTRTRGHHLLTLEPLNLS